MIVKAYLKFKSSDGFQSKFRLFDWLKMKKASVGGNMEISTLYIIKIYVFAFQVMRSKNLFVL